MSEDMKPITVSIFDKEYLVGCRENEREALFNSVEYLNRKMIEQRDNGKVIGNERIAVMAALNIANEYLEYRRGKETASSDIDAGISRMLSKITEALGQSPLLEDDTAPVL